MKNRKHIACLLAALAMMAAAVPMMTAAEDAPAQTMQEPAASPALSDALVAAMHEEAPLEVVIRYHALDEDAVKASVMEQAEAYRESLDPTVYTIEEIDDMTLTYMREQAAAASDSYYAEICRDLGIEVEDAVFREGDHSMVCTLSPSQIMTAGSCAWYTGETIVLLRETDPIEILDPAVDPFTPVLPLWVSEALQARIDAGEDLFEVVIRCKGPDYSPLFTVLNDACAAYRDSLDPAVYTEEEIDELVENYRYEKNLEMNEAIIEAHHEMICEQLGIAREDAVFDHDLLTATLTTAQLETASASDWIRNRIVLKEEEDSNRLPAETWVVDGEDVTAPVTEDTVQTTEAVATTTETDADTTASSENGSSDMTTQTTTVKTTATTVTETAVPSDPTAHAETASTEDATTLPQTGVSDPTDRRAAVAAAAMTIAGGMLVIRSRKRNGRR